MAQARGSKPVGYFDCAGGGQVVVDGTTAYVAHMKPPHGTTIVDVSDPAKPRTLAEITLPDGIHSHKVRVAGDVMVVNHERNMTAVGRRADELPRVRKQLLDALGREPTHAELAEKLGVAAANVAEIEAQAQRGYHNGQYHSHWPRAWHARMDQLRDDGDHGEVAAGNRRRRQGVNHSSLEDEIHIHQAVAENGVTQG